MWTRLGFKVTTVSMDSSESCRVGLDKISYSDPPGGDLDVHARVDELKLIKAEERLDYVKLPAVKEWWYAACSAAGIPFGASFSPILPPELWQTQIIVSLAQLLFAACGSSVELIGFESSLV